MKSFCLAVSPGRNFSSLRYREGWTFSERERLEFFGTLYLEEMCAVLVRMTAEWDNPDKRIEK